MAVLALAAGYAMSWLWWDVGFDTHLLGQYESVPVLARHVLPMFGGMIALAAIAPNMPHADILCDRRTHGRTAVAMTFAAVLASAMTPIVRAAFCVVPLRWIPRAAELYGPGARLADLASRDLFALMWMQCAPVLAVAMVAIAACGRLVGVVAGFGSYALLLLAASWRPIAALSPLAWDSSGYTGGRMIAVSAMFLAACVLQWACLRRGWTAG